MLRTDAFRARFLRLGFSFATIAILSAAACPTSADDAECGPSDEMSLSIVDVVAALASPDLETSFSGGVRTFGWSRLVENVCSNEHVKAQWHFGARVNQIPPGWRVDGGYRITALLGQDLTLQAANAGDVRIYDAETEIGLSQAFDGEPGRFLIFLDVSFTSRGNLQEDQEALQRVFWEVSMSARYKKHKT